MTQINKTQIHEDPIRAFEPLAVMVAAWDGDRVLPGSKHYFGVTITNRGDQDAVVQVRIESISLLLSQWCQQPEQWIALTRTGEIKQGETKSGELTFCIDVPTDALPQWLDYEVVVRPQSGYADTYLPTKRCRLQILAPEATITTTDPTFTLTPDTTPDRPRIVQSGNPIPIELTINNRSERVDRFRLDCTGLPDDWTIIIDYAQDFGGLGLVNQSDSLGLNPGDRGLIKVLIHPPTVPLAGSYLPTFRLTSENIPNLGLLGLIYLQVNPTYQLQAKLQAVQDTVRDRQPAQFNLQFANLGNTDRQLQFKLTPKHDPINVAISFPLIPSLALNPKQQQSFPLQVNPSNGGGDLGGVQGKPIRFKLTLQIPIVTSKSLPRSKVISPGKLVHGGICYWQH